MGKQKRFEIIYKDSSFDFGGRVLLDRETGVHYLLYCDGGIGVITPLLDRNGKPIITTVYSEIEK